MTCFNVKRQIFRDLRFLQLCWWRLKAYVILRLSCAASPWRLRRCTLSKLPKLFTSRHDVTF